MSSASDNFNRADGALAAPWVKAAGDTVSVISNTAGKLSGTADTWYYYTGAATGNDQFAQATLATRPGGATTDDWGPAVRVAPAAATGYFYDVTDGFSSVGINKEIGGAFTVITVGHTPWVVGDVVRLEVSGTTLTAKINGATDITGTDASITTGQPGFFMFETSSKYTIDDWSGGDLSSTTPVAVSDSGAGTDSFSTGAKLSGSDSGTGTDLATITAQFAIVESGTGAETVSITSPVSAADSGTGTDAAGTGAQISCVDSGAGTDLAAIIAQFSVADTGAGTDGVSVFTFGLPSVSDFGLGSDAVSVVVKMEVDDGGAGSDGGTVAFATTVPDNGVGSDAAATLVVLVVADAATGAEVVSFPVARISYGDSATSTEVVSIGQLFFTVADLAHSADTIFVSEGSVLGVIRAGRTVTAGGGALSRGNSGKLASGSSAGHTERRLI